MGASPILAGVTLSVNDGEFVGILGHNGMGKTTLLRTLMGYLPATDGSVHFDGARHHPAVAHRARAPWASATCRRDARFSRR